MNRLKALFPVLSATPGEDIPEKPETVADTLIPSEEEKKAMAAAAASAAETGQDGQPEAAVPAGGSRKQPRRRPQVPVRRQRIRRLWMKRRKCRKQPWSWRQNRKRRKQPRIQRRNRRCRMKLRIQRRNRRCPAKPRIHRQNPLFRRRIKPQRQTGSLFPGMRRMPGRCRIFLQLRCRRRQRRRPRRPDLKSLPGMRNWRSFWRQRPA